MPAVLTHKAIMLLARDRLAHVRDMTGRMIERKTVAGAPIPEIERKIHRLARDAHRMMSTLPRADVTLERERDSAFGGERDVFGGGVSKFAVLGCMGPDLPAFAELFRPGQGWAFDTIHKGTPDYNREAVIAGTTDMALAFHLNALVRIRETVDDPDPARRDWQREAEMQKARAYVLGHICHLAGDIVAHPLINDLEWHLGVEGSEHAGHGANEAAIDAAVARRVFRRASTREGQEWSAWWPAADEMRPWFFDAYADAFELTYGAERPKGFKDFEADLARFGPPAMSAGFMRDGFRTFRGLVLTGGYHWGYWHWFGVLAPLFLPLMASPLIAYAMPHARQFFEAPDDPERESRERRDFELVTLPFQLGALPALVYGAMLVPFAKRGTGCRSIGGLTMQALTLTSLVVTAAEAASVDRPDEGIPSWARWMFILWPAAATGAVYGSFALADVLLDFEHERPFVDEKPAGRRQLLNIVNMIPLAFLAIFFFGLLVIFAIGRIAHAAGDEDEPMSIGKPSFWIGFGLLLIGLTVLWAWLAGWMRDKKVPETIAPDHFALGRHAVRLFDDATLFADPTSGAEPPARYYPSDIRPLCRLWWEGAGEMQVRSDRFGLTFRPGGAGAAEQTVPGPIAPMTVAEYIRFLTDTVVDGAGATGGLRGAVVNDEAIAAYPLPPGATFAAHGDFETAESEVEEKMAEFKALGDSDSSSAYILYHAPKPRQAIRKLPRGPIRPRPERELRETEAAAGYDYILDPLAEDALRSDALMAKAADLGALLCMGAADHMTAGVAAEERVYQIFRNWSLDRRRVNEWRMIVEGGALSDKAGPADRYDAAMPRGLHGPMRPEDWRAPVADPADPAVLDEAESTARTHGWIGTLRDWMTAVEEAEDLLDRNATRPGVPSNRALSRALAYMFDAPDPAGGP